MEKKTASAIMLTLLLIGMLTLAFNIQPAKAAGTIYIRADGSIDPSTAPISTADNVTYTLTDDINDSIVVERDSVVVDGAGYTVQGTGGGNGIDLSSRSNVTVKNTQIKAFQYGIYLDSSSNYNSISRNNITTSDVCAIMLYCSSCNCVSGNNLTGNNYGVFLRDSPNNTVSENTMANNQHSIYLGYSYTANNTLSGNNITDCWYGIELFEAATNNSIVGNNITNNGLGIYLWSGCNQNIFSGNIVTNNSQYGIYLGYSASNRFCHNDLIDNVQQAYVYASGYANIWDDGYPSGGNYWSDYAGIDLHSGLGQNEAGSDGMGDTPYVINENNTDRYPLMNPWPSGWKLDFAGPTNHPIIDFAVYNRSLYAAADNKLYATEGSTWNTIDAPTYVTSLEAVNVANREPPSTEWNRTYGGPSHDWAYALVEASDGGYALAGRTYSYGAGSYDFWLVKTDVDGNALWNKTYGGISSDYAYALVQTSDGGYTLAGITYSYGAGSGDFWLIKTDSTGNALWNKTYGGPYNDWALALVETSDGGYAIAGHTQSFGAGSFDVWLVKTDANGNALWNKTYGGTNSDEAYALVETSDGGYALAGCTGSYGAGGWDFWLVKTDGTGNALWNKTYGGSNDEEAEALVQSSDGGYALAGQTRSYGAGSWDFWLVKTDSAGSPLWNKTYGRPSFDFAYALVQSNDGGYALAGPASYGAGMYDFWLVKTDVDGNALWNKTYGGTNEDYARALVQSSDGGYAITGYTYSYGVGSSDFWLVKTAPDTVEKLFAGGQGGLYSYDGVSFESIFSVPTYVKLLGFYDSKLYAGTFLDKLPKLYYCNGSADDPNDWYVDTAFQDILNFQGLFGSIDSFEVYDGVMYVSSAGKLYSFDGDYWSVVSTFDDVYAFLDMQVYNDRLYLATRDQGWRKPMYLGGSGFSGRVIQFDGENWTTVLDHDYWVYSLGVYDGKLYAGTANKILTYNGTDWETSFNATEGAYYAISMINYDGKIYAGMGNGYIFADPAPLKAKHETIVVPEFPSFLVLSLFMLVTLLAVIVYRRKHSADTVSS